MNRNHRKVNSMLRVKKIDESNKQGVINSLKLDVIRHVFAFYDIQYDPQHTIMYAVFDEQDLRGYILVYTALEFPSVVLEGEEGAAKKLIRFVPENRFIMHVPPNLLPAVKSKFPNAKDYVEDWMLVKKEHADFFKSKFVRRLCSEDDASRLAELLSSRDLRPRGSLQQYMNWISKTPTYGVFIDDELVSYAGSFIQLPQVWMIGGVYTHPKHRNKGYGTLATSAVTEHALKNAEVAALFVRSDNYPAIKIYGRIGYRKIGEKIWVDVGTGLAP